MGTYTDLQNQIASELGRSDQTTPIQTAIQSAIRHYQRTLQLFNQTSDTVSTVAGTAEYALPAEFIYFERVEITDANGDELPLDRISYDELATMDPSGHRGLPSQFAYRNYKIRLYPVPDAAYTVTVYYWSALAAPSNGADSTAWTNDFLDVIRHRAKWDINKHVVRDFNAAMADKESEGEVLAAIIQQRDRLLHTGRVTPTEF